MNFPPLKWFNRLFRFVFPHKGLARQIQSHPHTALDRYPDVFTACAKFAASRDWDQLADFRILSFGSSTGEEGHTLSKYFPNASILGVDVNEESIRKARQNFGSSRVRFEKSRAKILDENGPFDMVFCMSVLCHWPEAKKINDISGPFPFSRFEESIQLLHSYVKPGGLLVIYNSNYCFKDSSFYKFYRAVPTDDLSGSGFVHKFSTAAQKMEGFVYPETLFEKLPDVA